MLLLATSALAFETDDSEAVAPLPDEEPDRFVEGSFCEASEVFLPRTLAPRCADEGADDLDFPMGFEHHPTKDIAFALSKNDSKVQLAAVDAHTGEEAWRVNHTVGGEAHDASADQMDLAVGADGERVFVASSIIIWKQADGGFETLVAGDLMALDADDGSLLWQRLDPSIWHPTITVDDEGTLYVAGKGETEDTSSHYNIHVKAIDPASGNPSWWTTFDDHHDHEAEDIAVDSATGTVAVSGNTAVEDEEGNTTFHGLIIGLDAANSDVRWNETFNGASYPETAIVAQDEKVWVAGSEGPHLDALDIEILELDAVTGERQWTHVYDGPAGAMDWVNGLAVTSDTVIVHGISAVGHNVLVPSVFQAGARDWDAHVQAIDRATGEQRWVTFTDHPRTTLAATEDVAITSDEQTLVFTGQGYWPLSYDTDAITGALDMDTGEHEWVTYWNSDEVPSVEYRGDAGHEILLSPDEERSLSLVWSNMVFEPSWSKIVMHDLDRPGGALTYASAVQNDAWAAKR